MTEQLKAEAYVRKQRPALMELSFGCRVKYGTSYTTVWQVLLAENPKEQNHYNTVDVRGASNYLRDIQSSEIIGRPINLQDWLGVLEDAKPGNSYVFQHGSLIYKPENKIVMDFSMETGQPSSPADYKAFNDIVNP